LLDGSLPVLLRNWLRNRIVFPVTDAAGRTAGFASRTLDPLHSDYRFTLGTRRRYLLFGLREALLKIGSGSESSIFVVDKSASHM
jgi:DNA primase